jgi:hypothetical protein
MTMLDWNDRELNFPLETGGETILIMVDDALLSSALLPYDAAQGYYPKEAMIRDCIDRYLDMLARLQNFLDARLIGIAELRPYMDYWIQLTAGKKPGHHRSQVFILLLNYIQTYGFNGAARLIKGFGYEPVPSQASIKEAIEKTLEARQRPAAKSR